MALKNFLQTLPQAALLPPEQFQNLRKEQQMAGLRDMQIEAEKQNLQDTQNVRNLLQSSVGQGGEAVPAGAPALPLPQATPTGLAGEVALSMPQTTAQPLEKNTDRLTYEYYKTRNPEMANKIRDEVYKHAAEAEKLSGSPVAGLQILRESLGAEFKLDPVNKTIEMKEGDHLVTLDRTGKIISQQRVGEPKPERVTVSEGQQVWKKNPVTGRMEKEIEGAPKEKETEENKTIDQDTANKLKKPIEALTPGEKLEGRRLWKEKMKPPKDTTLQEENRLDRSYKQSLDRIDKQAGALRTQMTQLDEALDVAQMKNPQADAHVPIRTLLALVSGTKGFRMNQAEINSVVQGRTAWEDLKANLNRWSLDPAQPQIPDAQRQQIVDLLSKVRNRVQKTITHYDDAVDNLSKSDKVEQHRTITNKALREAENVDSIQNTVIMQTPDGKRWTLPNDPKKIKEAELRFKAKVISE